MKRVRVIVLLIAVALLGSALFYYARWNTPGKLLSNDYQSNQIADQTRPGVISLTGLPDQYCPSQAQVIVTDSKNATTILLDASVAVEQCRYIALKGLVGSVSESRLVIIKLSRALAFRMQIDSPKGVYHYAPSLGDVNGDNVIDSLDENQVATALFSTDLAKIAENDLDRDEKVTVLDLSLIRINHRTGIFRPDRKSWSKI